MTRIGIGIIFAFLMTILMAIAGIHLNKSQTEINSAMRGWWLISAILAFAGWCIWPNL